MVPACAVRHVQAGLGLCASVPAELRLLRGIILVVRVFASHANDPGSIPGFSIFLPFPEQPMFLLDKLFSALPAVLFLRHLAGALGNKGHFIAAAKIGICFVLSTALKTAFQTERRKRSFEFSAWSVGLLGRIAHGLKTNHAFPSSHAVFFGMYFLMHPTMLTLATMLLGALYRVYYEHHTTEEVLWGLLLGATAETLLRTVWRHMQ